MGGIVAESTTVDMITDAGFLIGDTVTSGIDVDHGDHDNSNKSLYRGISWETANSITRSCCRILKSNDPRYRREATNKVRKNLEGLSERPLLSHQATYNWGKPILVIHCCISVTNLLGLLNIVSPLKPVMGTYCLKIL